MNVKKFFFLLAIFLFLGKFPVIAEDNAKTILLVNNSTPHFFDVWEVRSTGEAKIIKTIRRDLGDIQSLPLGRYSRMIHAESKLVYIIKNNLWICDVYGKYKKQITTEGLSGDKKYFATWASIISWSPDGKKIVYELTHANQGEDGPELLIRPLNYGLRILDLINLTNSPVTVEGFSGFDFLNNIIYEKDTDSYFDEGKSFFHKPDKTHPSPWPATLQIMDKQGKSHIVFQLPDHEQIAQIFISEDGHQAVMTTIKTNNQSPKGENESRIVKVDLTTGQWNGVSQMCSWGDVWNPSLSPDNKRIAWEQNGLLMVDNNIIGTIRGKIIQGKWVDDKTLACVTWSSSKQKRLLIVNVNEDKIISRYSLK